MNHNSGRDAPMDLLRDISPGSSAAADGAVQGPPTEKEASGLAVLLDWWPAMVGVVLLGLAGAATFHLHATQPGWGTFQGDLVIHLGIAETLGNGSDAIPHRGFHLLVGVVAAAAGWSLGVAAVVVLTAATVATYLLTVHAIRRHSPASRGMAAVVAFLISVAAAIYLPGFSENWYLGAGSPNLWHNPTWVMMQPWAIGSFLAFVTWLQRHDRRSLFGLSATLVVSVLFKPSWAVVFVPVLAVAAVPHLRRRTRWHLPAAVLPTAMVMSWQFLVLAGDSTGGFVLSPFEIWNVWTSSVVGSVLLALAFPIVALIAGRRGTGWVGVGPAVGVFVVAFLQRSLLLENYVDVGNVGSWNWTWGYFLALKLLFVLGAVVVLRTGRWRLPAVVLVVHAGMGTIYLFRLISGAGFL